MSRPQIGAAYRTQRMANFLLVTTNPPTVATQGNLQAALAAAKGFMEAHPMAVVRIYKGLWQISRVDADARRGR